MIIKSKIFVGSFEYEKQCPASEMPEFAFIGRSNVGKSSLLNMLVEKKDLAHVSQRPGKTQTLNFFNINDSWHLVDLPGYGYARTSKTNKAAFARIIREYFSVRKQLSCAFVLIDGMISPQKIDLEFLSILGELQVPFVICYTKTDRVKQLDLYKNIRAFEAKVLETWEVMPQSFITSAERRRGRNEVLGFIEGIINENPGAS